MNPSKRPIYEVLIIGIGNELAGDDGVGVVAVRELRRQSLPAGVVVLEGGTALTRCVPLIAVSRKVIWVDAVDAGGAPGTIYRLPETVFADSFAARSAHGLSIGAALAEARFLANQPEEAALFGMQPFSVQLGCGLSSGARVAVPSLVAAVLAELTYNNR